MRSGASVASRSTLGSCRRPGDCRSGQIFKLTNRVAHTKGQEHRQSASSAMAPVDTPILDMAIRTHFKEEPALPIPCRVPAIYSDSFTWELLYPTFSVRNPTDSGLERMKGTTVMTVSDTKRPPYLRHEILKAGLDGADCASLC